VPLLIFGELTIMAVLLTLLVTQVVLPILKIAYRPKPHKPTVEELEEALRIAELQDRLLKQTQKAGEGIEANLQSVFEQAHTRQKGSVSE